MPLNTDMENLMTTVFERRTEERYPVHLPLRVRVTVDGKQQFLENSVLQNISNFGLLLSLQNDLPLGSKVVIELNPESPTRDRELRGQVVRREKQASKERIGIAVRLEERLNLSFAENLHPLRTV